MSVSPPSPPAPADGTPAPRAVLPSEGQRVRRVLTRVFMLFVIFFGLLLGARAFYTWRADSDYAAAVTATEELDKAWRWDDVEAQRRALADNENGALVVLAATKHFSRDWPRRRASLPEDAVEGVPLFERLQAARGAKFDDQLLADIRAEIKALSPVWQAAQPLVDRSVGRFPVVWTREWIATPQPHLDACNHLVRLAQLHLLVNAHDGDLVASWRHCRLALHAARAIGDEPNLRSQLFRAQSAIAAMAQFEGVLAQWQPPEPELTAALNVLIDESGQRLLEIGIRGDRAGADRFFDAVCADTLDSPEIATKLSFSWPIRWLYFNNRVRHSAAFSLQLYNEALSIARAPEHTQKARWEAFDTRIEGLKQSHDMNQALAIMVAPSAGRMAPMMMQHAALSRTFAVALAMEQFRIRNDGRWPTRIEQLVPDFLPTVPRDPFRDGPITIKPTADGWIIYSVGLDGEDNEGTRSNVDVGKAGTDIAVRLYHPQFRRAAMGPGTLP
ncbi:MAG TPA: hypothetical protein PKD86_07770 [Gemmatales bacterium]|nr:hypothetical protein [Gemmatales bacterium]HMP59235.1 hypothetical protein [Gemmatales bacterium]